MARSQKTHHCHNKVAKKSRKKCKKSQVRSRSTGRCRRRLSVKKSSKH
jgi:hypothetical protein